MNGEWISSDILGANSYKLIGENVYEMSDMAKKRDMDPYNDLIDFMPVMGLRDVHELSIVYAPSGLGRRWREVLHIVEESQAEFLYDHRYMWPLDCVSGKNIFGYIIKTFPAAQYTGISEFFVKPFAERWKLSENLLETVYKIHKNGIALNGMTREQIRVDKNSGGILIYPGFYLSRADTCRFDKSREGFFLIPEKIRKECTEDGMFTAMQQRKPRITR